MSDSNLPTTEPTSAEFSAKLRGPDILRIGVVLGALVVLLVSATFVAGASPRAASTSPGITANALAAGPAAGTVTEQTADGWQLVGASSTAGNQAGGPGPNGMRLFNGDDMQGMMGGSMPGAGFGRGGRMGGPFRAITITAINGSSLSLTTDDGWTRTITVSSSTAITKGGQTIALTDLKVGDSIRFAQTRNSDGTWTIDSIAVVVPEVGGTVASVTDNGFTLTARDGTTWNVTVTGSTAYTLGQKSGSKSDVTAGSIVEVEGATSSGNAITATAVHVQQPIVAGKVTATTADSITITTIAGGTTTVHVSSTTTYRVPGKTSASLSDVTVGSFLIAQGTKRSDGSIDAATVVAGGPGRGFGFGMRGGQGHPFGNWPGGPNDGQAPSVPPASPSGQGTNG